MKIFNPITLLLILTAGGMLVYVALRQPTPKVAPIETLAGFQTADAPLMLPADGKPRFRLHQLNAWERASLPRAVRFDPPMGTEHAGFTYNAQKFWEMNDRRGGHHTGDDLNGIGGMNTDLGDPVYAVADGRVLYAGEPSSGWGRIVVIGHIDPEGRLLQSMYAHLQAIDVAVGAVVSRGQTIGKVGTGNGHYPAHLHFELRESGGVGIGPGYSMIPLDRLDPEAAIAGLRGAPDDQPAPAHLPVALEKDNPWNLLELSPEDAARLGEILQGVKGGSAE